jgi:hypothetical protein
MAAMRMKNSLHVCTDAWAGAHALNNDPSVTGFSGNIGWFDNGAKYAVHKDIRNDSVSLKLDWQITAHATLTSITGFDYGRWYEKSDDGGLPITARLDDPNTYFSSVNAFSQEVRIASRDTGALGWLAGLYYGRESVHATVQFHFFDGYPGTFVLPSGATLFGFDEYNSFDPAGLGLLSSKYVELTLHGVNLSGNRLIQAPDYNASVGLDWRFAHLAVGDFRLLLNANTYGKQYFDGST